ncbi:MAG TPA: hypothetical protein P5326_11315 [Candidatus Contendobacter sp.]|nr:hypothetical protein [Candidatus Contendobacter sp.]
MGQTARQDILRLDSERVYDRLETLFCNASLEQAHARTPAE